MCTIIHINLENKLQRACAYIIFFLYIYFKRHGIITELNNNNCYTLTNIYMVHTMFMCFQTKVIMVL